MTTDEENVESPAVEEIAPEPAKKRARKPKPVKAAHSERPKAKPAKAKRKRVTKGKVKKPKVAKARKPASKPAKRKPTGVPAGTKRGKIAKPGGKGKLAASGRYAMVVFMPEKLHRAMWSTFRALQKKSPERAEHHSLAAWLRSLVVKAVK